MVILRKYESKILVEDRYTTGKLYFSFIYYMIIVIDD